MSEKVFTLSTLYDTYQTVIKELGYNDETIERMVMRPNNEKAFQRSLCRRAGIPICEDFTKEDLIHIVEDTNNKCETYAIGPYSEDLKRQGASRYVMFSNILYGILVKLDLSDTAEGLLYCDNKLFAVTAEPEDSVFGDLLKCVTAAEDFLQNEVLSDENMEQFETVTEDLIKVLHKARKEAGDNPTQAMEEVLTKGDTVREKLLASLDSYTDLKNKEENLVEGPKQQQSIYMSRFMRKDVLDYALKEIPELLRQGHEAARELKQAKAELEELRQRPVIPETDEEKVLLIKQILAGVDKGTALVLVRDIINAIIAN